MALAKSLARSSLARALVEPVTGVQKRSVGDLPFKTNPHVQDWAAMRDGVEHTFKFDGTTLFNLALWGVAVPALVYKGIVAEFDKADAKYKRPSKDFM